MYKRQVVEKGTEDLDADEVIVCEEDTKERAVATVDIRTGPAIIPDIGKRRRGKNPKKVEEFQSIKRRLPELREVFTVGASKSTMANKERLARFLRPFASEHGLKDPDEVSARSTNMLVELLSEYCGTESKEPLSDSAMNACIQGLRLIYSAAGHDGNWTLHPGGAAVGNPLTGNDGINQLRKNHSKAAARAGRTKSRAEPLTPFLICRHAEKFWFGGTELQGLDPDPRDVALHAIFTVAIQCGTRYDELSRLRVQDMKLEQNVVTLILRDGNKSSIELEHYRLLEYPGNTALRHSIYMDPKVAVLSWTAMRGCRNGFLFCNLPVSRLGVASINAGEPWPSKSFTEFMQSRLIQSGVSESVAMMYTTHSMKRGCVQLLRSLNVRDDYIMRHIKMSGFASYSNYCRANNDLHGGEQELFSFTSHTDMTLHALSVAGEPRLEQTHDMNSYLALCNEIMEDESIKREMQSNRVLT